MQISINNKEIKMKQKNQLKIQWSRLKYVFELFTDHSTFPVFLLYILALFTKR